MVMTTKIAKWGNSAAVRIPKEVMRNQGFRYGSEVRVRLEAIQKKYTLDELVSKMSPKNRYEEIDWGSDVGNEVLPPWKK